jgi:acyl carrier protein
MQDIKTTVRGYILDNFIMGGRVDQLRDSDSFMDNHIIDSTGFLEVISFLEETFGIAVEDDEMIPENLDSLNNIEAYINKKRSA